MPPKRLTELDSLRGLAALAVVLFHFVYQFAQTFGHHGVIPVTWAYWGKFGVHLFFMISGFVIFWSLQRCSGPLDFLVSRFSRLYPVYWAAAAVTFLILAIFGLPGREVDLLSALANLSMIQEYFGVPHIDGVYWTLTVELTFYAGMFGLFVTNQLKHIELWLIGLLLLAAAHLANVIEVPALAVKLLNLQYINLFAAGICFFRIWTKQHTAITFAALALSFAPNVLLYPGPDLAVFVVHNVVFALLAFNCLSLLRWKPLIFLGTISYSLYLIHQNAGYVILRALGNAGVPTLPSILIAIAVAIALASGLTILVETPARRALRNAYHRYRGTERSPSPTKALNLKG